MQATGYRRCLSGEALKKAETALTNAKVDVAITAMFLIFVSLIVIGSAREWAAAAEEKTGGAPRKRICGAGGGSVTFRIGPQLAKLRHFPHPPSAKIRFAGQLYPIP